MTTNWKYKNLSQLGTIGRGKSKHRPRNDAILYGGKYPFIQTSDIKHSNFYVNSYTQTYNEVGLAQSKLWQKDTLCMTIAANIAETAILSFPACFPDSIVGFVSDPTKSDVKFIKYALDFGKREFQKTAKGTAQDNLSLEKIDNLKIRVPDVKTQSRIASVLSAYDDLIENNEKRIKTLEEMAQRLYTEWFVKFKFPGHEKTPMVNSGTKYGMIPKGWAVSRLGQHLASIECGRRPKGGIKVTDYEIPSVGAENVNGIGKHDYKKEKFVSKKFFNSMKKGIVQNGDVAIYKDGAYIGKSTYFKNDFPHKKFCVNEHIFLVRTKMKKITQNILYLWLQRAEVIKYIRSTNTNSAQPGINQNTLNNLKILVPTESVAKKFDITVEAWFDKIINLAKQDILLSQTRNLLIPQLITGKRVLK